MFEVDDDSLICQDGNGGAARQPGGALYAGSAAPATFNELLPSLPKNERVYLNDIAEQVNASLPDLEKQLLTAQAEGKIALMPLDDAPAYWKPGVRHGFSIDAGLNDFQRDRRILYVLDAAA